MLHFVASAQVAAVWVAISKPLVWKTYDGRARKSEVAFRIDARDGAHRVDIKTMAILPWEAIDGGYGFAKLSDAKAHAKAYLKAMKDQATLSPKLEAATCGAAMSRKAA